MIARWLAAQLKEEELIEAKKAWVEKVARHDLQRLGVGMKPKHALASIVRAAGHTDILALLKEKENIVMRNSRRGSLGLVRTALTQWHAFAVSALSYALTESLPPRSSSDMSLWVLTFSSEKTASNYVGAIKWACQREKLQMDWNDETLSNAVDACGKQNHRPELGPIRQKFVFTTALKNAVVDMADKINQSEIGSFLTTAWEFTCRVQSEVSPLEVGCPEELERFPVGRHSSVFVEGKMLTIRWRYRKNMEGGSVLQRECKCFGNLPCLQHCVVGRLISCLQGKQVGDKVFQVSQAYTLTVVRRIMKLLLVKDPMSCTWRAVRRGVATEMASKGMGGRLLQEKGEWKSETGFIPYVDFDRVDNEEQQRLDVLSSSEDSEEDEG